MTTPTGHPYPPEVRVFVPWRDVLAKALDQSEVIGVADVVEKYLGRLPTRSEITSARRAANTLADHGRAQRVYVPSRPEHPTARRLLLTRPITDPAESAAGNQSPRLPRRGAARSDLQIARGLVRTMAGVAAAARLLDTDRLHPATAADIAAELNRSLRDIEHLRYRLAARRRGA